MKLAIISDIHLKFWERQYGYTEALDILRSSIQEGKPDLLINCGDQEYYWEKLWEKQAYVMGNHDYYGTSVGDFCFSTEVDGLKIAGTTLWTDMNKENEMAGYAVQRYLADFTTITDFTIDTWLNLHRRQLKFLEDEIAKGVDVIITHHCPSLESCHLKYKRAEPDTIDYMVNFGFASHLDALVEKSGAKIWAHGHTHDPHDYMIGNTRVVCNPCGYPRERFRNLEDYKPIYVEI